MLLDVAFVVGGLAVLTVAADRFVLGAARLATALRMSAVLVGAIVIGFGTSAPEFVVTTLATVTGAQDLAFGNIVGSNIANTLLVLGCAGLVCPLAVRHGTLRRELPLMLASVGLLAVVAADSMVGTLDALLLLAGTVGAVAVIVRVARRDRAAVVDLEAEVAAYEREKPPSLARESLLTLAGLGGTLLGAWALVDGAVGIAEALGVAEAVIGLSVVAVGTSLPELVTALAAARRRETDLVVGNVLGSNIFNSLPVAGVAGLLDTVRFDAAFGPSLAYMVGSCVLAAVFLRSGHGIARSEAAVLLGLFVVALAGLALLS